MKNKKNNLVLNNIINLEIFIFIGFLSLCNIHLVSGNFPYRLLCDFKSVQDFDILKLCLHCFVHVSWYHLFLDGSAFFLLYLSFKKNHYFVRWLYMVSCGLGSIILSFLFSSEFKLYGLCGLSGIAHGLMAILALEMIINKEVGLGISLFLIVSGKSIVEAISGNVLLSSFHFNQMGYPIAVSHLGGVLGGLCAYIIVNLKNNKKLINIFKKCIIFEKLIFKSKGGCNMFQIMKIRGFIPFILISFLNAFIDLGHKIVIQNAIFKFYSGNTQVILTAIVNALILLPFILLFSPAGFLSDKYQKHTVIKWTSFLAVLVAVLITISYYFGWFKFAFFLTFLLAMQSAFHSPAKYGYIKELTGKENIAVANSFVQAITIVAILLGVFCYSVLFEHFLSPTFKSLSDIMTSVAPIGFILIACTVIQALLSLRLPEKRKVDEALSFKRNDYLKGTYLKDNLKAIKGSNVIWLSIIGLSIFWGINQVLLATFGAYLKGNAGITNTVVAQGIMAIGGIGIIIGALVAGKFSKNFIETGLVPAGSIGITISLFLLPMSVNPKVLSLIFFFYGIVGGMFIVPLNSLIQFNAKDSDMGKVLASNNFIQNIIMLVFLVGTILFAIGGIGCVPIFYLLSIVALFGTIYTFFKLPQAFIRYIIAIVFSQHYGLQVIDLENLPSSGGVLLLGNHTSWLDWAILQMSCPRRIHFVMERSIYEKWYLKKFLDFFGVIPISANASKSSLVNIEKMLNEGEVVALFPEGGISRNGQLGVFKRGFESTIINTNAVIIPFYMRGLWGSAYSYSSSKYRIISRLKSARNVSVCYGKAMTKEATAIDVKSAVFKLSIYTWQEYTNSLDPIHIHWLKTAKKMKNELAVVDFSGTSISYHRTLAGTILFAKEIKKYTKGEATVGILVPTSLGGIITNLAAFMCGKTVVNLNYTASSESLKQAIKKANIKTIFASKKFLTKLKNKGFDIAELILDEKVLFLEDIKNESSKLAGIQALIGAKLFPVWLLRLLYFKNVSIEDTAAILFSSGSEGVPKGVKLTHRNIIGNIKQIVSVLNPTAEDVILNVLPLFHAFGLTVTSIMPLVEGIPVVCHPDPTDAATVGKLATKYNATVLFATSTFLRIYTKSKKIHPLMFGSLRMVVAGAERLQQDVREKFKVKFGVDILEGYGTTETTPVASVNIPDLLISDSWTVQQGHKLGTVGLPLPGSTFKIVDPSTLKELPNGEAGLILIGGTQIMGGYLNDDAKTNDVIICEDGIRWYKSGDKGKLDEDGFLTILDRYSRFAKLGGEMISLGAVESTINDIVGNDEIEIAAVALPDEKKGERVVLLISGDVEEGEIKKKLLEAKINPLMIPSEFISVDAIPKLGSGKNDFSEIKKLALEMI